MISSEKNLNPPNVLIHKHTLQFLAIRSYKMEVQISSDFKQRDFFQVEPERSLNFE